MKNHRLNKCVKINHFDDCYQLETVLLQEERQKSMRNAADQLINDTSNEPFADIIQDATNSLLNDIEMENQRKIEQRKAQKRQQIREREKQMKQIEQQNKQYQSKLRQQSQMRSESNYDPYKGNYGKGGRAGAKPRGSATRGRRGRGRSVLKMKYKSDVIRTYNKRNAKNKKSGSTLVRNSPSR